MEKSVALVLLLCVALVSNAQDSLCVFNIKGNAYTKISNSVKPLTKGSFINRTATIFLEESSKITAINSEGEAFKIEEGGTYKFAQLLKDKVENSKNLTSKYLKLIWNEFTKNESTKTVIGGVFRGDVLMVHPQDSVIWASSKLTFTWNTQEDTSIYYLFIRNIATDEVLKLATNGSQVTLYKEQHLFLEGAEFEWTVSTTEFPNLKNIPFYNFTLIKKNSYADLKLNYKDLVTDLKGLGLTESEIEASLCETYKLCK